MFKALYKVSFHLPALESNPIVDKMKMVEKAVALMQQPEVFHFNILFGVKAKLATVDTESIVHVKFLGDLDRVVWRREPRTWFWEAEEGRFLMDKSHKRRRIDYESSADCGVQGFTSRRQQSLTGWGEKDFTVRPRDYNYYKLLKEQYAVSVDETADLFY